MRQPPLHPKRSAALRLLAAGNGSLFAGVYHLHCRNAFLSDTELTFQHMTCTSMAMLLHKTSSCYNFICCPAHSRQPPDLHMPGQVRVNDAVSVSLQHQQRRQQPGTHPAPSSSGRAPPDPWACRTLVATPGSASILKQILCGVKLPTRSSMLAITGTLIASLYIDREYRLDCLQDDIPDQVATEDSDAAPGWEVPLRDVKGVTSVHVDVHNDLLWTGVQP
jgi:hypothetical protein